MIYYNTKLYIRKHAMAKVIWTQKEMDDIKHFLYDDSTVFLKRKKDKAYKFLSKYL